MSKKLSLDSDYDQDYTLIGIVSHHRDYRLLWSINEKMQICMAKMDDLKIYQDKKHDFNTFSFYFYEDPDTFKTYFFISNMGEKGLLFTEFRQTNYFLMVKGNVSEIFKKEIKEKLKDIAFVLMIHYIRLNTIHNIDNFFLDMELSMMEMLKKKK